MNIQLSGAEEFIDQKFTTALGQVLIRYVVLDFIYGALGRLNALGLETLSEILHDMED